MKHSTAAPELKNELKHWLQEFKAEDLVLSVLGFFDHQTYLITDRNHDIVYCSQTLEQLLALNGNDLAGLPCMVSLGINDPDQRTGDSIILTTKDSGLVEFN